MHAEHFFIALPDFLSVLEFTNSFVDDQVRHADYPVPEQLLIITVQLLAQLVEVHGRRLAVECAAVVVEEFLMNSSFELSLVNKRLLGLPLLSKLIIRILLSDLLVFGVIFFERVLVLIILPCTAVQVHVIIFEVVQILLQVAILCFVVLVFFS